MSDANIDLNELVAIEATPPSLSVNFDELKAAIAIRLERYDVVVTPDTVKSSKELATELNKIAGTIDDRRKGEARRIKEALQPFEHQMRELVSMCQDGRQKILNQVNRYEAERVSLLADRLNELREQLRREHGVRDEHHAAEYDDLLKISNITDTGSITKKARDALTDRVRDERAHQQRCDDRRMQIENQSLRAGFAASVRMSERIIQHADDATFQEALEQEINDAHYHAAQARKREEENAAARARAAERVEAESDSSAAPSPVAEAAPAMAPASDPAPSAPPAAPAKPDADGMVDVQLRVVLPLRIPAHVTDEQITEKANAMLKAGGFAGADFMEVERG